jgi:hypothetical protein
MNRRAEDEIDNKGDATEGPTSARMTVLFPTDREADADAAVEEAIEYIAGRFLSTEDRGGKRRR